MATITGTAGSDSLLGTAGNDVIDGAGWIDTINAGAGDDTVRVTHGAAGIGVPDFSLIDGGPGWDILDLGGIPSAGLYSSIGANLVDGTFWITQSDIPDARYVFSGVAHASGFEEIHLGPEARIVDLYTFNSTAGALPGWKVVGGDEDDFVVDGHGNDTIQTGAGSDTVEHYIGNDQVALGDGDDHFRVMLPPSVAEQVTIDGGAGSDIVEIQPDDARAGASFDLLHNVGQVGNLSLTLTDVEGVSIDLNDRHQDPGASVLLAGGTGNDTLESYFGTGAVTLLGREGNDIVDGEAFGYSDNQGVVTAYGGSGNDMVRGGQGGDWLMGGGHYAGDTVPAASADDGDDTMWGEAGNDHIWGNSEFAVAGAVDGRDQIDAGSGMDYVNGNAGDDDIMGGPGADRLYGGAGNDWISGDGEFFPGLGGGPTAPGNDHINGNKGDDNINGGGGDDELLGGQGNDWIGGDDGNDRLDGGQGNDNLVGGQGVDTLTGGDGQDFFDVSERPANFDGQAFVPDLITDFHVGEDLLYVTPFIADVLRPGTATDYVSAWTLAKSDVPVVAHSPYQVLEDAVAVQVGSDTYVFWDNYGNGPEGAVRLANVSVWSVQWDSFWHFSV